MADSGSSFFRPLRQPPLRRSWGSWTNLSTETVTFTGGALGTRPLKLIHFCALSNHMK